MLRVSAPVMADLCLVGVSQGNPLPRIDGGLVDASQVFAYHLHPVAV